MALHFVNKKTNSQNQTFSSWFKLALHQDYIDCLRDLGHPPPTETKALLQDLKAFEALKTKTATVEDRNETLEARNKTLEDRNETLEAKTATLEDRNEALEDTNETLKRQILELQKSLELERQTTDSISQILHKV